MNIKKELIKKINSKEVKIGIVGMGYVGLPLIIEFAKQNFKVIGFEIDKERVEKINNGKSYIHHIDDDQIQVMRSNKLIQATSNFKLLDLVDVIIICLPTPLTKNKDPDLSYIIQFLKDAKSNLKEGQIISLESTTYPGTTEEIIKPLIEESGFEVGKNFFLSYSPEREDPGNKKFNLKTIAKVIGGSTKNCLDIAILIYSQIIEKVVPVSNTRTAEMTKLLENIHRAVNIGLINELKPIAESLNIDLYEVIEAAATKPFGFEPYYPGPGIGGHCIPIDPFYLSWKAKQLGVSSKFIELAGEINSSMPAYVAQKISDVLNFQSKALKGSKLLILGIAYKKNVDDCRESPSLVLIDILKSKGSKIDYCDPFVKNLRPSRKYNFHMQSIRLNYECFKEYDAIILITDHDKFDYEKILQNSRLIIDTRGKFNLSDKVFRA